MDKKKAHFTKLIILTISSILIAILIFLSIANVLVLISRDYYGTHLYAFYILIIIIIIILDITSIRYLSKHYLREGIISIESMNLEKKESEEIIYCKSCGAEISDKAGEFCSKCGTKIIN